LKCCSDFFFVLALAPVVTDPPLTKATVDGLTVTLGCPGLDEPKPLAKWFRNGVELTGERYTLLENGDLEIRYVN
jgi:hypothetical protein